MTMTMMMCIVIMCIVMMMLIMIMMMIITVKHNDVDDDFDFFLPLAFFQYWYVVFAHSQPCSANSAFAIPYNHLVHIIYFISILLYFFIQIQGIFNGTPVCSEYYSSSNVIKGVLSFLDTIIFNTPVSLALKTILVPMISEQTR
jgi:hypothetical protein